MGDSVASCSFGGTFWATIFFVEVYFFLSSLLVFRLIVGSYITVLLHPVPRVVPLGFSLYPSFYNSILAPQNECVGGDVI